MTQDGPLTSADEWELTPKAERELIFDRLCDKDDYKAIGEQLEIEWFENNRVRRNKDEAREAIVNAVEGPADVQQALEIAEPDPYKFEWFYGWHYVVEELSPPDVSEGPAQDYWHEIAQEVEELVEGEKKLRAFLRGIVEGAKESDYNRVDFSDAEARGNQYLQEDRLSASHLATEPGLVTGIYTRSGSSSGRSYSVAPELISTIEAALEQVENQEEGPVSTPGQEVPDDIDRRVPKFEEVLGNIEVTDEDIAEFDRILEENDALSYWKEYIAPNIMHRDEAKKALLCMLASPDDKKTEGGKTKGRSNAIMYGPPGTGKTAFKNFLVEEFGAYSIDGARVSKVDLTYNKNTGEDGLLVRAHKGLAVIEESDEMDDEALGAALTALGESGRIEIRDMRLPAEVRGVMLGNYRSRGEIVDKHSEALFNRFEFALHFDRLNDEQLDEAIDTQIEKFRRAKTDKDISKLKKYISWVREFEPEISDSVREEIKEYKRNHIEEFENVREGISVMNVAYTIARLNHRDVRLEDFKRAFELTRDNEKEQPGSAS